VKAETVEAPRRRELMVVIWLFGATFLALCLLSYSPGDPCFLLREGLTRPVGNWMGPVGAAIAGWLMALVGYSSWLAPATLVAFAHRSLGGEVVPFRGESRARRAMRASGVILLMLSGALFLTLSLGRVEVDGEAARAGGIVGHALGGLFEGLVGKAGALFITALVVIVALMAAVDFSPLKAASRLADAFHFIREKVGDALTKRRQARLRREEVATEREVREKTRTSSQIRIVVDPPRGRSSFRRWTFSTRSARAGRMSTVRPCY